MRSLIIALGLVMGLFSLEASSANYPCSGSKGGVSHCSGATFVCNDGSTSGSKRNCSAESGGKSKNTITPAYSAPKSNAGGSCSCSSGSYCTGPRGGVYCINKNGNKSYQRR